MGGIVTWVRAHPRWSAVIALALAALAWLVLGPERRTYEYVTVAVDNGPVERIVSASGKVRALNTIKVGAEVSGQITEVLVDFNSPVRRGQVLAVIDPTRVRARVRQAEAQVQLARASLAQAEASVIRSRTDFEIQTRETARREELASKGFVSRAGIDQTASALASARAALTTAQAQVKSARAQIDQSEAELASARLDLDRTTIVAPSDGVVINKLVEPGTTVAASFQTPNLFEIAADTSRMQVEAAVDEADIGQVAVGQPVRFAVDSYPDETFRATVRQIRKSASENQNVVTYLVILDVDNRDGKLLTGMTANVEIVTGSIARTLRVPSAALRFRPRAADRSDEVPPGTVVWVAGADAYRPEPRTIRTGLSGEDFSQVKSGLRLGERVIVRSRSLARRDEPDEDAESEDGGGPRGPP